MSLTSRTHTLLLAFVGVGLFFGIDFMKVDAQDEQQKTTKDAQGTVFVLPVHGPINKTMLYMLRRGFHSIRTSKDPVAAVVIELNTPGGPLKQTEEILQHIRETEAPVYALVKNKADSAGAIIALGTDSIYMQPGSRIGSAMPITVGPGGSPKSLPDDVKEKLMSDVRAMVRGLAQENGHAEEVAVAMVDPAEKLRIGERTICPEGELLNLTAEESVEVIPPRDSPLLAERTVKDVPSVLESLGLANTDVKRIRPKPAEDLARAINMIAPLLLGLGILGIYVEITTPGLGIPGALGALCLGLALFGHYIAGLAGIEDVVLVVTGIALILVEIFLVPGVGVFGFLGVGCFIGGIILAGIPYIPDPASPLPGQGESAVSWTTYVQDAMLTLLISLLITGIGAWLAARFLPRRTVYGTLILNKSLSTGAGYTQEQQNTLKQLVGRQGVTLTPLRPAGTVRIEGKRYDVVTSGDLIGKDHPIKVVKVEGNRIIVEKKTAENSPQDAAD